MGKILLFLLSLIVGVGIFIWIVHLVGWQDIMNAFSVFSGWKGAVIFFLTFLMMLIGNWKWKEILKGEEIDYSFGELFKPYLAGFAIMFLAPVLVWAGEIFRAYSIKGKKNISWAKAVASVIIDRILEWTVNLIIILFGTTYFLYKIGLPPKNLAVAFGLVFLFFFVAIVIFYFKTFRRESIAKTFGRLFKGDMDKEPLATEKEIFNFFRPAKKTMWKSFFLSFLRAFVMYARAWFLILFLGKELSFLAILSLLGFTYLAAMIPIPTSLGTHEVIQTFAFNSLGIDVSSATAFTMIIRAVEFLFSLAGLIIFIRFGMIFLKNLLFKGIDKIATMKNKLSQEK